MAYLGNGTEYGIHSLILLAQARAPASSRDLAELQGVSISFLAKIFPKLEKAGIVTASEGIRGGYALARAPETISVLDAVMAIEGKKPLFDCQQIRGRCAVFNGKPPAWATGGVCGVHAVMLRAERSMREELARTTIRDLAEGIERKASPGFDAEMQNWLANRIGIRTEARVEAVKRTKPQRRQET